jgi:hypothetical protein
MSRRRRLVALAALVATCAVAGPRARADEPAPRVDGRPGLLSLRTDRVLVFKDGHALFVKTGTGTADAEGLVFTEDVPSGVALGCFWASATDGGRVLRMRAEWTVGREERETTSPCLTTLDLLRANVGRGVTLSFVREGASNLDCRVVEVLEAPPPPPDDRSPAAPPHGPAGVSRRPLSPVGGTFAVVEDSRGMRTALPVSDVRAVTSSDLRTTVRRREEVETRAKRLVLDLGADAAGKPASVRLLYFRDGVSWIPAYRVSGGLETDAEVALQGEVQNDAEGFEDAALDLVVGVPAFRFRDVASPLTLEAAAHRLLAQREQQVLQSQVRLSNAFSNEEGAVAFAQEGPGGGLVTAPELSTEAQQDLFLYGVGKASLRRGARAAFPLWQATAAARHLYTMDLEVRRDARSGEHSYRSTKSGALPERDRPRASRDVVWHEIELENATRVPWTTGAALLARGDVPLGQHVLGYTPVGGKTLLPVTVAVDVSGRYAEREIDRRPDALRWGGNLYSLVRKECTVTLVSHRREPTPARVNVSIGGRAESATDGGRVVLNDLRSEDWPGGAHSVNNHSDVSWDFSLAPGETRALVFVLSFYVR